MATFKRIKCETCGRKKKVPIGQWNAMRTRFCSRECGWESRRLHRTVAEKKYLKRLYDIEFRKKNRKRLLAEKRAYHAKVRDRVSKRMKAIRKTAAYKRRMRAYLKDYWKRPGLKDQKRDYDRKFRAKKKFGPLWESHYLMVLINEEVKRRMSNYEIRLQNNTLNKAMNRGRNGQIKRGYT